MSHENKLNESRFVRFQYLFLLSVWEIDNTRQIYKQKRHSVEHQTQMPRGTHSTHAIRYT